MTAFASLSGVTANRLTLSMPVFGAWVADVYTVDNSPIQTQTSLIVGNMTLACAVYRQATYAGFTITRVIAGAGGWRMAIPVRQYAHDAGVKKSTVLSDAATECGEKIQITGDASLGGGYVRAAGLASDTLREVTGGVWFIDNAGVTQTKSPDGSSITSDFTAVNQRGGEGVVEVATEDYASWQPGRSFDAPNLAGPFFIRGVRMSLGSDATLRLEVMT